MQNAALGCLLVLVICLSKVDAAVAEADCSHGGDTCKCGIDQGDYYEYICYANGSEVAIKYKAGRYVDVSCDDGADLSQLADVASLRGAGVPFVRVDGCGVTERLLPAHMNASAVTQLRLVHAAPPGPAPSQLAELGSLGSLELRLATPEGASAELLESLAALVELEELTLWGAPPPERCGAGLVRLEVSDVPGGLRLGAGRFVGCPALRQLLIYNAGVRELHEDALRGLARLQVLDLSNNDLRELPTATFLRAPSLTNLSLSANPLQRLTAEAMRLPKLQELLLLNVGERLQLGGALSALPALRSLAISGGVDSLAGVKLTESSELRTFALTRTHVKSVPEDMLLEQRQLRTLDLSKNLIEELSPKLFSNLGRLEELNLDGNRIRQFVADLCVGMRSLVTLSARDNALADIHVGALAAASGLRHLSLADNALHSDDADSSPFNNLIELETLDLSNNTFEAIAYDWQSILLKLKRVDLSHNRIATLTLNDLNFIGEDVTVDLRHNNITGISVTGPLAIDQEPADLPRVTLLLSENPYSCDCGLYGLLQFMESHRSHPVARALAAAECASPPPYTGRSLSSLTSDRLSCPLGAPSCPSRCECTLRPSAPPAIALCPFAALSSLPAGNFTVRVRAPAPTRLALPPLVEGVLSLSFAGMGLISFASPHNLPLSLREVDLSDNSLTAIDGETLSRLLGDDRRVRLGGNAWACGCGAGDFVRALRAAEARVADWNDTVCAGGGRLAEAAPSCVGVVTAWVCVVAAVTLAAVMGAAWRMRRNSRARSEKEREAKHEAAMTADCRYDVFVSHAHEDAPWVWEELQPALEGAGLRLCVHSRDWLVGEAIPAQIERSVANSRRTLLLLSRHFLHSAWALLEFRTALSASGSRPRLIAVLLEPATALADLSPPDLREWLSTTTYLPRDDSAFWEKLFAALPRPLPRVPTLVSDKTPH